MRFPISVTFWFLIVLCALKPNESLFLLCAYCKNAITPFAFGNCRKKREPSEKKMSNRNRWYSKVGKRNLSILLLKWKSLRWIYVCWIDKFTYTQTHTDAACSHFRQYPGSYTNTKRKNANAQVCSRAYIVVLCAFDLLDCWVFLISTGCIGSYVFDYLWSFISSLLKIGVGVVVVTLICMFVRIALMVRPANGALKR